MRFNDLCDNLVSLGVAAILLTVSALVAAVAYKALSF